MTPMLTPVALSILALVMAPQWDPTNPEDAARQSGEADSGAAPLGGPDVDSEPGPSGGRAMGEGLSGPRGGSGLQGMLQQRCGSCHGPEKQKGGVRLVPIDALFKGDSQDWVVIPRKPDESILLERVMLPEGHEDIMPSKGDPLSKVEIERIRKWIAEGTTKERLVASAMQGGGEVDPRTWGLVYLSLDLTDAQREEAERTVESLRRQRPKRDRRGGADRGNGGRDRDQANPDSREQEEARRTQRAKMKELKQKMAEAQEKLWDALTPEQQEEMRAILGDQAAIAKLRQSMKRRNGRRGGGGFPGSSGGRGGRGGGRGQNQD